jgi:hypothetical protein
MNLYNRVWTYTTEYEPIQQSSSVSINRSEFLSSVGSGEVLIWSWILNKYTLLYVIYNQQTLTLFWQVTSCSQWVTLDNCVSTHCHIPSSGVWTARTSLTVTPFVTIVKLFSDTQSEASNPGHVTQIDQLPWRIWSNNLSRNVIVTNIVTLLHPGR